MIPYGHVAELFQEEFLRRQAAIREQLATVDDAEDVIATARVQQGVKPGLSAEDAIELALSEQTGEKA